MTKDEEQAIRNVIARLREPNCGGVGDAIDAPMPDLPRGFEAVSRVYLNTWIIPALELLLPGDKRNPKLAAKLAER